MTNKMSFARLREIKRKYKFNFY